MAMIWSDNFSVGVSSIDEQHKELFHRTNRLLEACQEGRGKEVVKETIDFLGEYVSSHFSHEEGLMQKYRYPEYASHKALHEGFIRSFKKLQEQAQENIGLSLVTQVNKIVVDWWVHHILNIDRKLGQFLINAMKA
jgi:hemerythrin